MTIRVVVADDQEHIRMGLAEILAAEADVLVVGTAVNGAEAVRQVTNRNPDVALVDLRMPGVDGVVATTRIVASRPDFPIVILTAYDTDSQLPHAIAAGAHGYLLKTDLAERAVATVRAACRGESLLDDAERRRLEDLIRPPVEEDLTRRELQVLGMVAEGLRTAEVARQLFVSDATVKTHLLHAYAKLHVRGRSAAVEEAVRRGLIPEQGNGAQDDGAQDDGASDDGAKGDGVVADSAQDDRVEDDVAQDDRVVADGAQDDRAQDRAGERRHEHEG